MKSRTKKLLSLLLATAMVFTMNTFAFGEEASLADVVESSIEAVNITTNVESDGFKFKYDEATGTYKSETTIEYATDGNKKSTINNVATIKNVTDPVSWNNAYGTDLMEIVLEGSDDKNNHLNNSKKMTVSINISPDPDDAIGIDAVLPEGFIEADESYYKSIALADPGYYLFLKYGLDDLAFVEGADDWNADEKWFNEIPIATWDGRVIDYNKSGLYKKTKSKIEKLDVKIALVKYENGTVTEIPGAEVSSVKIDKKAVKNASVSGNPVCVAKTFSRTNKVDGKDVTYTYNNYPLREYKIVNGATLPTFTVTAKTKGKNADLKKEKKNIATALKSEKFTFAIKRRQIPVNDIQGKFVEAYNLKKNNPTTTTNAEKLLDDFYAAGEWDSGDTRSLYFGGGIMVTKYNGKKATLVLDSTIGDVRKGYKDAGITLKDKTDYTIENGTLGGESVAVLSFPEKSNYEYDLGTPNARFDSYDWSDDGYTCTYKWSAEYEITPAYLGYKNAFRVSPKDKTKLRSGIFKADGDGFVYSAE